MCFDLDNFCSQLAQEQRKEHRDCASYKWMPYKTSGCPKKSKCQESKGLLTGLVSYLHNTIEPSFDNKQKLIPQTNMNEEHGVFEEYDRIVASEDLDRDTKLGLLDTPDVENIQDFTKMLFRLSKATKEIIVTTYTFLRRLLNATSWKLTATNWRVLIIISLRLAQKYEGFPILAAEEVSFMYKLFKADEFAELEFAYANAMDYKFFVSPKQYELNAVSLRREGKSE